jgi:integrase
MERIKVPRFQGVYYRKSAKRNYRGKPDKCFDVTFKDANSHLIWEKVGWASEGYTAQMASQVRGERIRTLRHGKELPNKKGDKTLQSIWDNEYKGEKSGKKSFGDDCWRYDKHIKPVFGNKRLAEITPASINKFKNDLAVKEKLSAQTVTHILNLVKSAFNVARRNGLFDADNPVAMIEYPSTENSNRLRYLKRDEAEKLLDKLKAASQTQYEMAYLSLYNGIRADEIFKLRWQDVDLDNNIIHILESKNTEARTAYITEGIRDIFDNKVPGQPKQYVFPQEYRRGKEIGIRGNIKKNQVGNTFRRIVDELKLNAGVDDDRYKVVFHTLRHTFGSWLAIRGESLQTIKELMGHRRISQTMRYAHLSLDMKRQAVERLHQV